MLMKYKLAALPGLQICVFHQRHRRRRHQRCCQRRRRNEHYSTGLPVCSETHYVHLCSLHFLRSSMISRSEWFT